MSSRNARSRGSVAAPPWVIGALLVVLTCLFAPTAAAGAPALRVAAAAGWQSGKCTSGDTSSVTVVIDFQRLGGNTIVRCAHGLSAGARGAAALAAAGISYEGTNRWGAAFVCRILGRPSPTESIPVDGGAYTEPCTDTPPAKAYWSYWQANENGGWDYSQLGVLSQKARLGGFEGWSFSLNATASTNPAPRVDTSLNPPTPVSTTSRPTTAPPTTARPTTARPTTAPPNTTRSTSRPTTAKPTTAAPTRATPTRATPQNPPAGQTSSRTTSPTTSTPDQATGNTQGGNGNATTSVGRTNEPAQTSTGAPGSHTSPVGTAGTTSGMTSGAGSATASPGAGSPGASQPGSGSPSSMASAGAADDSASAADAWETESPSSGDAVDAGTAPAVVTSGSPWPVIGVGALVIVGAAAAFLVARRRSRAES